MMSSVLIRSVFEPANLLARRRPLRTHSRTVSGETFINSAASSTVCRGDVYKRQPLYSVRRRVLDLVLQFGDFNIELAALVFDGPGVGYGVQLLSVFVDARG